jgi:hypothetical protein
MIWGEKEKADINDIRAGVSSTDMLAVIIKEVI